MYAFTVTTAFPTEQVESKVASGQDLSEGGGGSATVAGETDKPGDEDSSGGGQGSGLARNRREEHGEDLIEASGRGEGSGGEDYQEEDGGSEEDSSEEESDEDESEEEEESDERHRRKLQLAAELRGVGIEREWDTKEPAIARHLIQLFRVPFVTAPGQRAYLRSF